MIRLVNCKLDFAKKEINKSFDSGINTLSFDFRDLFSSLKLKDTELNDGVFLINGISIFDRTEYITFSFEVNSQVINLVAVFLAKENEKDELVGKLRDSLLALKDMPLETKEDKKAKLKGIFDALNNGKLSYVLIDKNNELNLENFKLAKTFMKLEIPYIVLEKKPEEIQENAIQPKQEPIIEEQKVERPINEPSITVIETPTTETGEDTVKEVEEIKKPKEVEIVNEQNKEIIKKNKSENGKIDFSKLKTFFKDIGKTIKLISKNFIPFYIFLFLFAAFSSFGSFFFPRLFELNNITLAVVLLIDTLVFFGLNVYFIFATYHEYKDDVRNAKYFDLVFHFLFTLLNILGVGMALGISFAFVNNNILIKKEEFKIASLIAFYIVSGLLVVVPIFTKLVYSSVKKFTGLFKKKN